MDPSRLIPGDASLIENIVSYLKAKGIFDEFRHECLADVDTKSSFQNLNQRVDGYTSKFMATETWNPDLNKNDLRNKLRRHIDESGMLAVGADHVVEQVINPKIHPFFLPKIIEVVHQFLREQNKLFSKKTEAPNDSSVAEKPVTDVSDGNASKTKTTVSDPIADILSFSFSKAKPTAAGSSHGKAESAQQKHVDLKKKREEETAAEKKKKEEESAAEKKKREEESATEKKSIPESVDLATEDQTTSVAAEMKSQSNKEKVKKEIKVEESESNQESFKKAVKEDMKLEKKKTDDAKIQSSEAPVTNDENKTSASTPVKTSFSYKKPFSRTKHKCKPKDSSSSKDAKKHKKESSDKSLEKHQKHKPSKSTKEISSPTKTVSKSGTKEKISSGESSSNKTLEKKSSKDSSRKESIELKHKKHFEKSEKIKILKKEQIPYESGSAEKGTKNIQYSSSHDSSQGSDQEKSSLDTKKEKKHFSKHLQIESSEKQSDKIAKTFFDKKRSKDSNESSMKKHKSEKNSKLEQTKVVGDAAKISSRSNSFGSTSSVSSSSNASKDNLASTSDDISENSSKDKKKKAKEKDSCQVSKTLPPPPPPPPPSGALTTELTSSAEMSSMEDTQSSSNSENSSSEESTEESPSDSESDSPLAILEALEKYVPSSSADDINDFYDIFLYSSSSEDFEGYGTSPERKKSVRNTSDVSVSSVHTSDLSSFDDELSDDEVLNSSGTEPGVKKRFTLKEAQQLIQSRALLQQYQNKIQSAENKSKEDSSDASLNREEKTSVLSSEDESSPSEPKRSLRRERKLNPRYASSEYTSIFNCKKESFITKQSTPVKKTQSLISSPVIEPKQRRRESMVERGRTTKKASEETGVQKHLDETTAKAAPKGEAMKEVTVQETSKNTKVKNASETEKTNVLENWETSDGKKASEVPKDCENRAKINLEYGKKDSKETESQENLNEINVAIECPEGKSKPHGIKGIILYTESLNNETEEQLSSSDEMSSIMDKEHLYRENNDKTDVLSVSDHLKVQFQFKPQNNSKLSILSHPAKRKLQMEEAPAAKRPCSRSSVDSSSSESAANENKPFNTGKQNSVEEKILRDHNDLKAADLTDKIKNDLFCKKNNNGDILGQKEIMLNSHGKAVSVSERKAKESDSSKDLNSL